MLFTRASDHINVCCDYQQRTLVQSSRNPNNHRSIDLCDNHPNFVDFQEHTIQLQWRWLPWEEKGGVWVLLFLLQALSMRFDPLLPLPSKICLHFLISQIFLFCFNLYLLVLRSRSQLDWIFWLFYVPMQNCLFDLDISIRFESCYITIYSVYLFLVRNFFFILIPGCRREGCGKVNICYHWSEIDVDFRMYL